MMRRFRFDATDAALAADARRSAAAFATERGLDEGAAGKLALVVTEAATNLVKHGGGGEILVGLDSGGGGVDVLALDRGPGMANPSACIRDGFSTSGTPGTGLGAISRLASSFDIHSAPGAGTALVASIAPAARRDAPAATFDVGGVSVPATGETACGDAWATSPRAGGLRLIVVDGLGHGALAQEAAQEAVGAFRAAGARPLPEVMEHVHGALRSTRGAAVGLVDIDARLGAVTFCGVGNVGGTILGSGPARNVVSLGGIAGQGTIRLQTFAYPWPAGGLLVLFTDGIVGRWSLDPYPGLRARDPLLIAGVLYRDFARGRDDATVVVARERAR